MYIGEVSAQTGASVKAIRLYESLGLLAKVQRQGRYRVYSDQHLTLVRLIMQAKDLGFTLGEMRQFVERDPSLGPWSCILLMINNKQQQVEQQLLKLQQQHQALIDAVSTIQHCLADNPDCK